MTRVLHAWRALEPEQRLAACAALALLLTMFLPWYGLQGVDRKSGAIYSHNINAFGDVSFVEAAIFLVAGGVLAMMFARGEGRDFQLPGGDGAVVTAAGCWAAVLIFYRVFSRPAGNGYPVGIEWGFFLAFMAAGALAYSGWRMRAHERPQPPLSRQRAARRRGTRRTDDGVFAPAEPRPAEPRQAQPRTAEAGGAEPRRSEPRRRGAPAPVAARERPRYPPAPPEQLSFEDPPTRAE
jgi:hypothetical protein